MNETPSLLHHSKLSIIQRHEMAEIFGFETRNKYEVRAESGEALAFVAEQQKGFLGFLMRQFLGHWRRYDIHFFTPAKTPLIVAHHPFRWIFQRLEVTDNQNQRLGAIQQRFSILTKRFDVENEVGQVVLTVSSPFWRIWTFPFMRRGAQAACITKRWSGLLSEAFTDKDNFVLEFNELDLTEAERKTLLAAAIFIDLQYFEKKAGRSASS